MVNFLKFDPGFLDKDENGVKFACALRGLSQILEVMLLIPFLITLLVCQLIGEITVMTFGLSLPGPVIGMAVLFLWLIVTGKSPDNFESLSNQLLAHLSLLFVPAGVGVMLHFKLLGEDWAAVAAALIVSTLVTIAVTGWVMARLSGRGTPRDE